MVKRLSTGIDTLDDHLNGGPRPGTVISLAAPPDSQAESLLYSFMRKRPTLYITTVRREDAVRDELEHVLGSAAEYTIEVAGTQHPIRNVNQAIEQADTDNGDEPQNVIIDTMNALERTNKYNRYVDLLNAIKSYMLLTDGLALFHCCKHDSSLPLRELTLTVSDVIMDLDVVVDKNTVQNHLTIPKFRSREVVEEVIKLKLGQEALVDTSRNL